MYMAFARRLKPTHLRLILRVAETGKLQSAADEVAMSQPAASRMLSEIEAMVGVPLFQRHPKGMEPTAVGKAVAGHARQILQGLDALESEVSQVAAGRSGIVRIGSVTGPAVGVVVPAMRAVRKIAPDVEFTVEVRPSTTLMRGLDEGGFDLIIARLPPDYNSRNYRVFPARNELISLLVARDHPMAGRRNVRLRDLTEFEWVIQERGTPIREAVEGAFHANSVVMPAQVTSSSSLLVALALLERSTAIAPQSHEVVELLGGEALDMKVTRLQLHENIHVSPFFVIVQRDRQLPPVVEHFIRETFQRL